MAGWLLEDWPERFVEVCRRERVMATTLMDDMEPPPFWYWRVIAERLRVVYARWRDPAKPRGAQTSYAQTGPRGPNAFLAAQEKRILFVRAHPELWRWHAALAKALKAAGLYRPSTHWTNIQRHCPKLVALARQPSEGRRPEHLASRAPGTPGDRQRRRSLPRRERRIRFVRAHRELWPQLRALADALQAAGLYSPAVSNYNIRQRCPALIALARERDAAAQAGKSARKATCPPVPADG